MKLRFERNPIRDYEEQGEKHGLSRTCGLRLDRQRSCSAIHFSFPQSEVFHVSSLEEKVSHSQ